MLFLYILGFGLYIASLVAIGSWWFDFTFKRDWFVAWMGGVVILVFSAAAGLSQLAVWAAKQ